MKPSYPTIRNCNYETRGDNDGATILEIARRAEAGGIRNGYILEALNDLEITLRDLAEDDSSWAAECCTRAEKNLLSVWRYERRAEIEAEVVAEYPEAEDDADGLATTIQVALDEDPFVTGAEVTEVVREADSDAAGEREAERKG